MEKNNNFFKTVCNLAIPVALQSMLQSSFSIIDQIMIGQLGSASIAGVGFAGKFVSIFSVLIAAIGAVAGIMISQYLGQNNKIKVTQSFHINLLFCAIIVGIFSGITFAIIGIIVYNVVIKLYHKMKTKD